MKFLLQTGAASAIAVLASLVLAGPIGSYLPKTVAPVVAAELASPYLKLISADGTGSGVHIGNGYILTAAHVGTMKDPLAKDDAGRPHKLVMLWANTQYDIALMRMEGWQSALGVKAAPLSCDRQVVGTHVRAYGNPMNVENVYASGSIVGAPANRGPWQSVMTLDLTIVPGMSGGALVDDAGQVVGIDVGVMVYGSLTGFGFAVPSTVACDLMGKA
jgi:S1-C subfamily serine protease